MKPIDIEIWQDGVCVVSIHAPEHDALREARHYAMIYGQDGPAECFRRVPRTGKLEPFALQPDS